MKISFAPSVMECEKLKAGTAALLEGIQQIPENLEVTVEFNENPQLIVKRAENQIQIICKEAAHYYRGLNQAVHHLETDTRMKIRKRYILNEMDLCWTVPEMLYLQ